MSQPVLIDTEQTSLSELLEHVQDEAHRLHVNFGDIVREKLEAMTGKTVPADVALKRLREKLANERHTNHLDG